MYSNSSVVALVFCLFGSALPHQHAVAGSTTSVGRLVVTGKMSAARATHSATLLSDGKVLIAGGMENDGMIFDSAELYDGATGQFHAYGENVRSTCWIQRHSAEKWQSIGRGWLGP